MDIQSFGHFLREAREQREISLDEAVKTLKIQRRILESFEEGDFSQGGSPVQVRGMLRNYARFLRLEEDIVLQHYETAILPPKTNRWLRVTEESQAIKPATQPRRDTLAISLSGGPRRTGGPRFAWVGRLLTTLVGLSLIGVIIFFVGGILNHTPPLEGDTQPTLAAQISTIDPTLATATYTATWTPLPDVPTTQPTLLFLNGKQGSTIDMNFVQSSWVVVVGDGVEQFRGFARPGETQTYNVTEGIEITLANAAALELKVNGQSQEAFGERGKQVTILINSTGLQVIHPGATPTIDPNRVISPDAFTITETPDPSLLVSATLAETPTIEASATLLEPTLIGAEFIATVPATTDLSALTVSESATPDPATLGSETTLVPTLTPFSFMANAAVTEATATAVQITPVATLTSPGITPTAGSQASQGTVVPTLTPFNFAPQAINVAQPTEASAEIQAPTVTQEQADQAPTQRLGPSVTPSNTATSTATATPDIRPTAIVPLRITQSGLPTKKAP